MKLDRSQMKQFLAVAGQLNSIQREKLKPKDLRIIEIVQEAFQKKLSHVTIEYKFSTPSDLIDSFALKADKIKKAAKFETEKPPSKEGTTFAIVPNFQENINGKLFAHIHADEFGSPSEFEGNEGGSVLKYVADFLKLRKSMHLPIYDLKKQDLTLLENTFFDGQAQAIDSEALKAALNRGEPFLILGGWSTLQKGESHAVYYELIPELDGTISFRIYNLGSGAFAVTGDKALPVIEWRGISKDKILALDIMKEHKTAMEIPGEEEATNYSKPDIYEGLKGFLEPKETRLLNSSVRPLKMQRAGFCTYRSLLAFLSTKMDETNYSLFKTDLKLQSLVEFSKQLEKMGGATLEEKQLLKKSIRKLSRTLVKLHARGIIDEDYLQKAASIIKEAKESKLAVYQVNTLRMQNVEDTRSTSIRSEPPSLFTSTELKSESQIHNFRLDELRELMWDPASFENDIEEFMQKVMTDWENGANLEPHMALEALIRQMPDSLWLSSVDSEKTMEKRIELLTKLLQNYFKTCFTVPNGQYILPERIFLIYKIAFLQKSLLNKYHIGLAENFFGDFTGAFKGLPLPDEIQLHSLKPQETVDLKKYLEAFSNTPKYCFGEYYNFPNSSAMLSIDRQRRNLSGFVVQSARFFLSKGGPPPFYSFFSDTFPEMISYEKSQNPDFIKWGKDEQELRVLTSDAYPPWFLNIRSSFLYGSFLLSEQCVFRPDLDRSIPAEVKFIYKRNEGYDGGESLAYALLWNQPFSLRRDRDEKALDNIYPAPQKKQTKQIVTLSDGFGAESALINPSQSRLQKAEKKALYRSPAMLEDVKDFAYLKISGILSLSSLTDLLAKEPHLLLEPDYQIKLQKLVLKNPSLFQDQPFVLAKFFDELDKIQNEALLDNQMQAFTFTWRLKRYILQSLDKNDPQEELRKLRSALQKEGLNPETKSLLYAELIGCLSQVEKLEEEDIKDLIYGHIYLKHHPLSQNWITAYQKKEINECPVEKASQIVQYLKDPLKRNELCQSIISEIIPNYPLSEWDLVESKGHFPNLASTLDGTIIKTLSGELISSRAANKIPADILTHPTFEALFKGIEEGEINEEGILHFKDIDGRWVAIENKEGNLIIEKMFGNPPKPARYITADKFVSRDWKGNDSYLLESRYVIGNYDAWIQEEDAGKGHYTFLFTDKKSKQVEYFCYASLDYDDFQIVSPIFRAVDNAALGKTTSSALTRFEDSRFIHQFHFKGTPSIEINYPRYNLMFYTSSLDPYTLFSNEFPGFFINHDDAALGFNNFNHFLLLENGKGEKKVIMPMHHFKKPEKRQDVFTIQYQTELELDEPTEQKYFVYNVKGKTLSSDSRLASLYLAEVALLDQKYKTAHNLLSKYGKKLSRFTEDERKILEKIAAMDEVTGNKEGDAIGIQLKAAMMLLKNLRSFPQENESLELSKAMSLLSTNYELYRKHRPNSTFVRLKEDEESEIKQLLNIRIGTSVPNIMPIVENTQEEQVSGTLMLFNDFQRFNYALSKELPSDYLITRSFTTTYSLNFFSAYLLAKDTSPETEKKREKLKAALLYSKGLTDSQEMRKRIIILETVLNNPNPFPEIPEYMGLENWEKEIISLTNSLRAKSVSEPEKEKIKEEKGEKEKIENPFSEKTFEVPPLSPKERLLILKGWKEKRLEVKTTLPQTFDVENLSQPAKEKERDFSPISASLNHLATITQEKVNAPLIQSTISRINDGLRTLEESKESSRSIKEENLPKIKKQLLKKQKTVNLTVQILQEDILGISNKKSDEPLEAAKIYLMKTGGITRKITMNDVLNSFAKQNPAELMALNPALTKEDVMNLFHLAFQFLEKSTLEQKFTRSLKLIDNFESQNDELLLKDLYQELKLERHFDPGDFPAFMVFEYYAAIGLRPDQIELLKDFIKTGDINPIRELIMGSGKSSVLLPLLGFMRANGENLSLIIVPPQLFPSTGTQVQTSLEEGLSTGLRTFHFDRNTKFDALTLKLILEELESIKNNRECLIVSNKSIPCLLLRTIEKAHEHYSNPTAGPPSKELKLMLKILTLISNDGVALLDEGDTLLNILHEICFSLGEKASLEPLDLSVISLLYSELYFNPAISKLTRVESAPPPLEEESEDKTSPKKTVPVLTELNYHEKVKLPLAKAFLNSLKAISVADKKLEEQIRDRFSHLSLQDEELFLAYLTREKGKEEAAERHFSTEEKAIRNVLALAGEEISSLLPHTLLRSHNENYGLDKQELGKTAVPFSASQVPSTGSQFVSAHVTSNYTLQSYSKEPIPSYLIKNEIKKLQQQAKEEMAGSDKPLQELEAWKKFKHLIGDLNVPLFNLNAKQLELIVAEINKDPKKRLFIAKEFALPELELYRQKISVNPMTLVSFLGKISAFTGTLWDPISLHRKLTPQGSPVTDAYTIALLFENSFNAVTVVSSNSPDVLMDELQGADLVGDSGGYFKDMDNDSNAKKLFEKTSRAVVYFRQNGELVVLTADGIFPYEEVNLRPEERDTLLTQIFMTGSNVPQKDNAVGIITIGPDMILRDLLQGVWRLRGLDRNQKVKFLIKEEVAAKIYEALSLKPDSEINFAHILNFCILNQAARLGKNHAKAFSLELNEIKQKIILDVLMDPKALESEKRRAFELFGSSWIQEIPNEAADLYGALPQEFDSNDMIEKECAKLIAELKEFSERGEKAIDEVKKVKEHYLHQLPSKVTSRKSDENSTLEREEQKISEVEKETEFEFHAASLNEDQFIEKSFIVGQFDKKDRFSPDLIQLGKESYQGDKQPTPVLTAAQFLEEYDRLSPYAKAFDNIDLSLNLISYNSKRPVTLDNFHLFGSVRKKILYLYLDEANDQFILLSHNEAKALAEEKNPNLFNLNTGYIFKDESISEATLKKIVKAKFLAGISTFNPKERDLLKDWLREEGFETMEKFFLNQALNGQKKLQEKYKSSPLKRIFAELKAESKLELKTI